MRETEIINEAKRFVQETDNDVSVFDITYFGGSDELPLNIVIDTGNKRYFLSARIDEVQE